jgi:hypothetical protein
MKMQLNRAILEAAIVGFERQKQKIDETIAELRAQLDGHSIKPGPTAKVEDAGTVKAKRKMSSSARKRIAAGQKKRWEAFHAKADAGKPAGKTAAKATTKKAVPAKAAPKKKMSGARKAALVANLAKARAARAAKRTAGGTVPF